jgi:5-(carboxyamino)imidazole ribonucleotide mutase
MKAAARCLEEFGIPWEAHVLSAHRVPDELGKRITEMENAGVKVFICGAGLAAHLPGVVASKTILPVIGVPLSARLDGQDALYSIVQMPRPIPVACVGIDNSYNAGMLAVQMLALGNADLSRRLGEWRENMRNEFIADSGGGVEL